MIEPTGYTALDLIGFTDRGAYDPDAYYVKNDIATVGNTKWRCLIDDTHNVTPTEGANWTIYLESATSLAGMSDVTLTSPKNGDGLVHDGNDWKNIPIMTKEQWKKNGAYNLACGVFTSKVENGSTWIANPDGSVSVSGESTGSNIISLPFTLKAGTYLVGFNPIPTSGGVITDSTNFSILDSSSNHLTGLPLNDATSKVITVAADTVVRIRLYAYANSSGHTTNTTFYPVITTDLNATVADFVSPAKTNRELTEDLEFGALGASLISTYINTSGGSSIRLRKWGHMCILQAQLKTTSSLVVNTQQTIATLPSGYIPKYETLPVATYDIGTSKTAESHDIELDTNGNVKLTLRNTHDINRWVYATMTYICE